jgi:alanine dehydrogenase
MPAIVPHTSTYALTNVTLSYAIELANKGLPALRDNPTLRRGLNTLRGQVTHAGVATAFGFPCGNVDELLKTIV